MISSWLHVQLIDWLNCSTTNSWEAEVFHEEKIASVDAKSHQKEFNRLTQMSFSELSDDNRLLSRNSFFNNDQRNDNTSETIWEVVIRNLGDRPWLLVVLV